MGQHLPLDDSPNEIPPLIESDTILATLTTLSDTARSNNAAALTFYRRAFHVVAIAALLFVGGLIWAGATLSTINSRGTCNATTNHVIAKDVHLLVTGQIHPSDAPKYTVPPICH